MNLNFLKTFVRVVESGNFSRAAGRMHLSQPAVSMQMQSLADDLGVELFRRTGHRLETTEAGTILYKQAKEMLSNWQVTVHQLDSLRQRLRGRLELGASTIPGDYLLPSCLCEFYNLHPDLQVYMTVGASREIVEALVSGGLDLAVVGYKPDVPGLESEVLFEDDLVTVFSPEHKLARRKSLAVEDLLSQPMLRRTGGSATRQVLEDALEGLGCNLGQLRIVMELGSTRALLEAAARGLGVAVVSKLAAADYIEQGRLLWSSIAGLELRRSFWLVHSRIASPVQAAFVQFLQRGEYHG